MKAGQLLIGVTVSLRTQPRISPPSICASIKYQIRPSELLRSCRITSAPARGGSEPITSEPEPVEGCERTRLDSVSILMTRHSTSGVLVTVGVSVVVGVSLGVSVGVMVGVWVGVDVSVGVSEAVTVNEGVMVGDGVYVQVGVLVTVVVLLGVAVSEGVAVSLGVGVLLGVGVSLGVGEAGGKITGTQAPRVAIAVTTMKIMMPVTMPPNRRLP